MASKVTPGVVNPSARKGKNMEEQVVEILWDKLGSSPHFLLTSQ
jgi:hypothetical protein